MFGQSWVLTLYGSESIACKFRKVKIESSHGWWRHKNVITQVLCNETKTKAFPT